MADKEGNETNISDLLGLGEMSGMLGGGGGFSGSSASSSGLDLGVRFGGVDFGGSRPPSGQGNLLIIAAFVAVLAVAVLKK